MDTDPRLTLITRHTELAHCGAKMEQCTIFGVNLPLSGSFFDKERRGAPFTTTRVATPVF